MAKDVISYEQAVEYVTRYVAVDVAKPLLLDFLKDREEDGKRLRRLLDMAQPGGPKITAEAYAMWLLVEEMGEALQLLGKGGRFGMDTPGVKDALTGRVDMDKTPRNMLPVELGDVIAATEYAARRGVVSGDDILCRAQTKLDKLTNPNSRDNLGRRLAPGSDDGDEPTNYEWKP